MKSLKIIFLFSLFALLVSCSSDNVNMEEMIPDDATGVISINIPSILDKASCVNENNFTPPAELTDFIKSNNDSFFADLFSTLPQSGLDFSNNAYIYFTNKTFRVVGLFSIKNEDAVKKYIEQKTGQKFKTVTGTTYLRNDVYSFAIDKDVLFIGRESKELQDDLLATAAQNVFDKTSKNIRDIDEIKECIEADNDINAYFNVKGFNTLIESIPGTTTIKSKFPLFSLFFDSDIKSFKCSVKFQKEGAEITTRVNADDNSEYIALFNTIFSKPDSGFLNVIPSEMNYVFSVSLNGESLLKNGQIKDLINKTDLFDFDVRELIATIDGPIAIAFAPSMNSSSQGDLDNLNLSIAFKSNNANKVIEQIKNYARSNGQSDLIKDGRHLFDLQGKPIYVGTSSNYVYADWLDHELIAEYYSSNPELVERFSKCPLGFFLRKECGKTEAILNFGFEDAKLGKGIFYTSNESDNAIIVFLKLLCEMNFSQKDESDYQENFE